MYNKHDYGYKKFFSNPKALEYLLKSFVDEQWVHDIDYSKIIQLDKSFFGKGFIKRESDLIFRVPCNNKDFYLFIIMEFQSTVDRFMSLRFLRYLCEFYEHLIQTTKTKCLPSVFPILLYNGNRKWTAPDDIKDLIEQRISSKYIPSFSYYKIAENEYTKEFLLKIENIVSALFYLENSNPESIQNDIDKIINLLKNEKPSELQLISEWITYIFNDESGEINEKIQSLVEVKAMFVEKLERYGNKIHKRSVKEGIEQGIKQVALSMYDKGYSVREIIELTSISEENLQKILNQHN